MRILLHTPAHPGRPVAGWWDSMRELDLRGLFVDCLLTRPRPRGTSRPDPYWARDWAERMNWARQLALRGGYDLLCNVESDHVFAPGTLQELVRAHLEDGSQVTAALYRLRNGHLAAKLDPDRWLPEECKLHARPVPVWLVPFGFTLIAREVLERVEFDTGIDASFAHRTQGFRKVVVPWVRVGHVMDGRVLWP